EVSLASPMRRHHCCLLHKILALKTPIRRFWFHPSYSLSPFGGEGRGEAQAQLLPSPLGERVGVRAKPSYPLSPLGERVGVRGVRKRAVKAVGFRGG
ncbi:MAG TPA: hypothetical protein VEO37_08840, partial [Thermoanaerobaculia bacterium]|nr:hypothetical protein [Thermoanaerobaculia bacterium]